MPVLCAFPRSAKSVCVRPTRVNESPAGKRGRHGRLLYRALFFLLIGSRRRRSAERGRKMDTTTLVARRERALGAGAPLFYDKPLHIVRGEGVHLFDETGRRYVDMYN